LVAEHVKVVDACVRAGLSSVDEEGDVPEEVRAQKKY